MTGSQLSMTARRYARTALLLALTAMAPAAAWAQEAKKDPANPVGGNATWTTKVDQAPIVTGIALDPAQAALIAKISTYFNELQNLKGAFVQTGPDGKRLRGRFYVKRPGRLRFEYALPSKQLIVSDGPMVAIPDIGINTHDRIALDQTPFRILLGQSVDLIRDAKIIDVQQADDIAVVTIQDKSPDAPGLIKLFMSKQPQFELREWVTTDAQGLDTRVEVSNLVKTEDIDVALFKITSPQLLNMKKNQ
jgi:outer membrane lipoprotein-sorting protein